MDPLPKNIKQSRVVVYSKDPCPSCVSAKNLLLRKGVSFEVIDTTHNPAMEEEMIRRASPRKTYPQIFIDDQGVGGYADLKKLDEEERLEDLLFPRGR